MECTKEMDQPELCCAPFATGLEFSRKNVAVTLDAAQACPGSALAMQTDATDPLEEIVIFCTSPTDSAAIAAEEGASAVQLKTECFSRMFTVAEVQGLGTYAPGQILFENRLAYFARSGVPVASLPTCAQVVDSCPSGAAPAAPSLATPPVDDGTVATSFLRRTGRQLPLPVMTAGTLTIMSMK
jgi:hypothetical protein